MKIEDFIIDIIKDWKSKFTDIESVRYAYDEISDFHIIEISPSIIIDNDDFAEEESNLWVKFMELYPDADLLISDPSDLNDMSNIIYNS